MPTPVDSNPMGRNPELVDSDVYEVMESANRPVWTANQFSEQVGVSRPTASKQLKKMADAGRLEAVQVGNATAYYLPGLEMKPISGGEYGHIKASLRRTFEDKFIGLVTEPWEVGTEKPAEPGDRVQLQVDGSPGNWGVLMTRHYDNRRKELHYDETGDRDTQALISGEVYEKPTVPIEHIDYPDDYDLEKKIGGLDGPEIVGDPPVQGLLLGGFKNYLCRPANDAKFIRDIEIEWVNPESEGQELESVELVERPEDDVYSDYVEDIEPFDPEELKNSIYADIVMLSGECEPRRAYLEQRDDGEGYDVIPADMAGDELTDYEPTDRFKRKVRSKTVVDGPLQWGDR